VAGRLRKLFPNTTPSSGFRCWFRCGSSVNCLKAKPISVNPSPTSAGRLFSAGFFELKASEPAAHPAPRPSCETDHFEDYSLKLQCNSFFSSNVSLPQIACLGPGDSQRRYLAPCPVGRRRACGGGFSGYCGRGAVASADAARAQFSFLAAGNWRLTKSRNIEGFPSVGLRESRRVPEDVTALRCRSMRAPGAGHPEPSAAAPVIRT
jgi:hypothetical protein